MLRKLHGKSVVLLGQHVMDPDDNSWRLSDVYSCNAHMRVGSAQLQPLTDQLFNVWLVVLPNLPSQHASSESDQTNADWYCSREFVVSSEVRVLR